MFFKKSLPLLLATFSAMSLPVCAQEKGPDVQFSLGTGYPFFIIPQVSLLDEDKKYYLNYKIGLDDGFTVGVDWLNGHHSYGVFAGAIGARDAEVECNPDSFSCNLSNFFIFDDKTTQGIGLAYEYRFNGQAHKGWAVRFEAGYGEESRTDERRADGNIQVLYHF